MENLLIGKVCKVGTGHGIIIPVRILRALNFQRGDRIIFGDFKDDSFRIKRFDDNQLRAYQHYLESKIIIKQDE